MTTVVFIKALWASRLTSGTQLVLVQVSMMEAQAPCKEVRVLRMVVSLSERSCRKSSNRSWIALVVIGKEAVEGTIRDVPSPSGPQQK